jgi:hypothetical protein
MPRTKDTLLVEAHRINYRLRSTFFYRKLKEYRVLHFASMIEQLFPVEGLYNWDKREQWGIGEDAFRYIQKHSDLKLIQVFCHPKLLQEYPALLAYYRNVAVLSQKSVRYLVGIDVKRYEANSNSDNRLALGEQQAIMLARLFNQHITLIVDSSIQSFTAQELHGLLLTSAGTQIDGSWRNAIGEEAEKVVHSLLLKEAVERNLLRALIPRPGVGLEEYDPEQLEALQGNISHYRGVLLSNQTSILFSSEPDVRLVGKYGNTLAVIEIKGGTDPAGALERYGAAKKSFEEALRTSSRSETILLASCITQEVRDRIDQDTSISQYFDLTEVVALGDTYDRFMNHTFSLLLSEEQVID